MNLHKDLRILTLLALAIIIGCFYFFNLKQYFTLEYLKSQEECLRLFCLNNKMLSFILFVLSYVFLTILPAPVAIFLALLGGALFGFPQGSVFIGLASTIGATISFLIARYLLMDYVQGKYGSKLEAINEGIEKDGAYYLFALRLTPVFPFVLLNILMGVTPMALTTFYIISQIGMLPEIMIVTYLGQQLSVVNSLQDVISPSIIISLMCLGMFPLLVKYVSKRI
jgi:uncharacterized membrane protein YdjX (TVP38/TMEM64 family)